MNDKKPRESNHHGNFSQLRSATWKRKPAWPRWRSADALALASVVGLGACTDASTGAELPDVGPASEIGGERAPVPRPDEDPSAAHAAVLSIGRIAAATNQSVSTGACKWYTLTAGTGGLFVRTWITVVAGDADLFVYRKAADGSWDLAKSVGATGYEQVDVVALDTQPMPVCVYGASTDTATYVIGVASTGSLGSPITPGDMYHAAGSSYHHPLNSVDDTFALDLNRPGGADDNESVAAVLDGQVVEVDATRGYVLLAHARPLWFRGVKYLRFYTGYLHMEHLAVTVGQQVVTGTPLGEVGGMPRTANGTFSFPQHLHFTVYVESANRSSGRAYLRSLDVADALGGPFRPISLGPTAVGRLAEPSGQGDAGTAVYRAGTGALNLDRTLGQGGSLHYTTTTAASNLVIQWALGRAPSAGSYRIEAFVPRRHGTTTAARYDTFVNGVLVTSRTVSQLVISDAHVEVASLALAQDDAVVVTVGNATADGAGQNCPSTASCSVVSRRTTPSRDGTSAAHGGGRRSAATHGHRRP